MAEGVFISYRRDDAPGHAGRLYDSLVVHFGAGRVFMDVDSIDPGVDFVEMIEATLANAAVVVVVIGPGWLHARDELGSERLGESGDFVHLEVRRALELDKRVIPVLVDGARPPGVEELPDDLAPLARRNVFDVSDIRFHSDVNRLAVAIDKLLAPPPTAVVPTAAVGTSGSTTGESAPAPDAPDGPASAAGGVAAMEGPPPPARLGETSQPGSTPPPLLVGPVRRRRWLLPVVIVGAVVVVALIALLVVSSGGGTGGQADDTSDQVTAAATDQSATDQGSSAEPTDGASAAGDGTASAPAVVGTIATGAHPVEVEVVEDGLWVQVDGGLERYPASGDDANASATIDLGPNGNGNDIVPGDGVLYVMLGADQEVAVVDLTTDEVDRIPVVGAPLAGALLDDTLWVTAHGDFDGAPGALVPITDGAAGTPVPLDEKPYAVIAYDDALWVTFAESDGLAQIDPATSTVTARYSVGPGPVDVQAIDDQLWVTLRGADQVAIVDPTDGMVVDSVDVGVRPWKLAEGFDAVWVSNRGDDAGPGSVSRIDPTSLTVTADVPTEVGTDELAIGPNDVFAVNNGSGTVSVISPSP